MVFNWMIPRHAGPLEHKGNLFINCKRSMNDPALHAEHLIKLKSRTVVFCHEHGGGRLHKWSRKDANRVILLVAAIPSPSRLPRKQRGLRRRRCLLPQWVHHRLVGFLVLFIWRFATTQGVILQRIVHDWAQVSERVVHRDGSFSASFLRSYNRW